MIHKSKIRLESKEFSEISSEILKSGKAIRITVSGNSMFPMIRDGDILLINPKSQIQFCLGDVILFTTLGGRLLAHRIIYSRRKDGSWCYITQGDHNSARDGCITPDQILGSVVRIVRNERVIHSDGFLYNLLGKIMVIYLRNTTHRSKFWSYGYHMCRKLPFFRRYLS